MNSRIIPIMRKEFIHIRRDPRTLTFMFLIPVIQLVLLGYAATTDVEHLATAVLDYDRTSASRELVEAYRASNYFDIAYYIDNEEEMARLIDGGKVRAGIIIPAGYKVNLEKDRQAQIAFIIDGSDPTVARTVFSAATAVGQAKSVELVQKIFGIEPEEQPGIEVRPRVWYNPEMRSANFMIPGVIAIILQLLTTFITGAAIVREREQGTIEQLIVTPIKSYELVLGKVIPYVAIAFFDLSEVLIVGVFWFGMPIHGSIPLLLALALLSLLTSLGLGLLISTVAHSQMEAMLLTFLILLPSMFLSGFLFPIEAMPKALQLISYIIPLRYLLIIVRGIILKGVGLRLLTEQVIAITIFGAVILTLASLRFKKSLE